MMNIAKKNGITLVELLVTLAVVSSLALLILPSVKSLLLDRKGSNSAIMVKNFLEVARTRAMATGKPVAVIIERLSSRPNDADENGRIEGSEIIVSGGSAYIGSATAAPVLNDADPFANYLVYNTSIRLSMADTPAPLGSDTLGVVPISIVSNGPPVSPVVALPPSGGFQRVGIYLQQAGGGDAPYRRAVQNAVVAGAEISFGLNVNRFVIAEARVETAGLEQLVLYFLDPSTVLNPTELAISNLSVGADPSFIVYGRPKPVSVQNITLPKGTCIDLSISGFSETRTLYELDSSGNVLADPLRAARDYRLRLSSAWVSPIQASPPTALASVPRPHELRPIYVVFNPDGSFGRIYANFQCTSTSTRPNPSFKAVDAAEDLFLHMGKIDQVSIDPTQAPYSGNLADPASYIIRISPRSGAIVAAPTGAIRPEDVGPSGLLGSSPTLGECVALARKRSFGQYVTGQ